MLGSILYSILFSLDLEIIRESLNVTLLASLDVLIEQCVYNLLYMIRSQLQACTSVQINDIITD